MICWRAAWPLVFFVLVHVCSARDQSPDFENAIKPALGEVYVSGVDEDHGSKLDSRRGTGFFVDKFGAFITARHLRRDLAPGVHDGTVQCVVVPAATFGQVRLPAAIVREYPESDLMVLFVALGQVRIRTLEPKNADSAHLVEGQLDALYTIGYEIANTPSPHTGTLSTLFGPPDPGPRWLIDIPFSDGQSGAPILSGDGYVVAVGLASDVDSGTRTKAAPITEIDDKYFRNPAAFTGSNIQSVQSAPEVTAFVDTPLEPETKRMSLAWKNQPCKGPETHAIDISATPGWEIDPATAAFIQFDLVGTIVDLDHKPTVKSDGAHGINVSATIKNEGICENVPRYVTTSVPVFAGTIKMTNLKTAVATTPVKDKAGSLSGQFIYTETPIAGQRSKTVLGAIKALTGAPVGISVTGSGANVSLEVTRSDGKTTVFGPDEVQSKIGSRAGVPVTELVLPQTPRAAAALNRAISPAGPNL